MRIFMYLAVAVALGCGANKASETPPTTSLKAVPAEPMPGPPDKVVTGSNELELAMAPFIADAKASYPAARERFVAGLPEGHVFFVVTRLVDQAGNTEQIFVRVESVANAKIAGTIASKIGGLKGYAMDDPITIPESEIADWVVARPDGTEEGNVVGKFVDYWRPDEFYGAVFGITVTSAGPTQVRFLHMIDRRDTSIPANFSPPSVFLRAAIGHLQEKSWPESEPDKEFFTYALFWPLEPTNVTKTPPTSK